MFGMDVASPGVVGDDGDDGDGGVLCCVGTTQSQVKRAGPLRGAVAEEDPRSGGGAIGGGHTVRKNVSPGGTITAGSEMPRSPALSVCNWRTVPLISPKNVAGVDVSLRPSPYTMAYRALPATKVWLANDVPGGQKCSG